MVLLDSKRFHPRGSDRRIRASHSLHGSLYILNGRGVAFFHRLYGCLVSSQETLEVFGQTVCVEGASVAVAHDGRHTVVATHYGIASMVGEVEDIIRGGLLRCNFSLSFGFRLLDILRVDVSTQCCRFLLRNLLCLQEVTRTSKGIRYSKNQE